MNDLLSISLQSAAIYILIIACLRLLGKKGLAEISLGDLVLVILIGEAIGSIIPQDNGFESAIVCILTLSVVNFVISRTAFKFRPLQKILEGEPVIVISDGKVLLKNMEKEKLTIANLKEALRSNGLEDFKDVKLAVLETDGEVSIIPK
jgi:uncharacterized membrane protein YcaP (DUF421 family)